VETLQAQEVTSIFKDGLYWCVTTADDSQYSTLALLIATGARYRRLDAPGEANLIGTNIHFCATCDGAFYKGKRILVVGGGNSGFEEGLFLTKFADQVDIVEYSDKPRASQIIQEKVASKDNMRVILNHQVIEFKGENQLQAIMVKNHKTDEIEEWHYDGVFVFIGLEPNSGLIRPQVETDPAGFIETDHSLMTSQTGIFAAGDVRHGSTKQAASAAGEGATAAIMIRDYLRDLD
jgi:thioredoxin reductase (NADPH)